MVLIVSVSAVCEWRLVVALATNVFWNHKEPPTIYEGSKVFQQVRSCLSEQCSTVWWNSRNYNENK
jgi:hypothetical protein